MCTWAAASPIKHRDMIYIPTLYICAPTYSVSFNQWNASQDISREMRFCDTDAKSVWGGGITESIL